MSKPAPTTRPLNGYALTNHFRKLRLREVFSPLEAYLFFELVAICNDEDWAPEFSASNGVLQAALGCSEQGLINARQHLAKAGLIAFISGNRRTPTNYRFTVQSSTEFSHKPLKGSTEFSHSVPYEADGSSEGSTQGSTQGSTEFSHSVPYEADGSSEGSTQGSTEFSPYKEQTKTKTLSEGEQDFSQNPVTADSPKTGPEKVDKPSPKLGAGLNIPFAEFWQAYGKKEDRHKSEQRWRSLTPAERAAALAAVPAYVASKPDRQYRKNPLTWLNGKCWQDMDQPGPPAAAGHSATSLPVGAPLSLSEEVNPDFEAQQRARLAAEAAERAQKFRTTYATPAPAAPSAPTLTPAS